MEQENNVSPIAQYSVGKILGIWTAAAIPMAILGWVVYPELASESTGLQAGTARVMVLTVGLIWQFVLAMIIVYHEEGDLRWATIQRRLRLNTPRDPKTSKPRGRLWLWLIPGLILVALVDIVLGSVLVDFWVSIFPFFAEPSGYSATAIMESPEIQAQLVGAWRFLGLFFVNAVFNTVLGEEFLFRGVLLPKMIGVFGKWDWVANSVIFGVYHLHQPWGMLRSIINGLLYTFPAKRFRSTWMSIIIHSGQSMFFLFLILGLVLGLA